MNTRDVAVALREWAHQIETDGTPAQIGPDSARLRDMADAIDPRGTGKGPAETYQGFGIINPYGGVWSYETFSTPDEAWRFLKAWWRDDEAKFAGFTVERVHVLVSRVSE